MTIGFSFIGPPAISRVPPGLTTIAPFVLPAPSAVVRRMPPFTVIVPLSVFAPLSDQVPLPLFTMDVGPPGPSPIGNVTAFPDVPDPVNVSVRGPDPMNSTVAPTVPMENAPLPDESNAPPFVPSVNPRCSVDDEVPVVRNSPPSSTRYAEFVGGAPSALPALPATSDGTPTVPPSLVTGPVQV